MMRSRALILACALFPAAALGAPTDQVQVLRQEVAALQIDHTLNLTQQQAKTLLPILQEAQAKVQTLKAQRAAAQPAVVAALTQAVADMKANGTVSPSTVQAMQAARGASFGAARQDFKALFEQAKQVLTPAQVEALKSAKTGILAMAPNAGPDQAWRKDGRHPGARFFMMRALLSDSFVALVQARAG
jgi:HAMP domain-containing protein